MFRKRPMTNQGDDLHLGRWRLVQVTLAQYGLPLYETAIADLDGLEREAIAHLQIAAQPRPHFYEIVPQEGASYRT
jgi:hypothetical protein